MSYKQHYCTLVHCFEWKLQNIIFKLPEMKDCCVSLLHCTGQTAVNIHDGVLNFCLGSPLILCHKCVTIPLSNPPISKSCRAAKKAWPERQETVRGSKLELFSVAMMAVCLCGQTSSKTLDKNLLWTQRGAGWYPEGEIVLFFEKVPQ